MGLVAVVISGLSPRVRGNLPAGRRRRFPLRSIPACAGEPAPEPLVSAAYKVYPRVCGGTGAQWRDSGDGGGLSPRVRGNPRQIVIRP